MRNQGTTNLWNHGKKEPGNYGIPKGGFKEIRKGAELRTQRNVESRGLVEQICSK